MANLDITNFRTIYQNDSHANTSDKYSLIPTSRVLGVLADHGWFPSKVNEARTRKVENRGFQKHVVRLKKHDVGIGEERPEIVLINSHMGSSSFQIMLGVYRLVCANGLTVGDTYQSHRVRHVGYTDDAVSFAIDDLSSKAPQIMDTVQSYKAIPLELPERVAFAEAAIEMVNDGEKFVMNPREMLLPRRWDDKRTDLWTTFNTIQENVIRGGLRRRTVDGRRQATRAIKSVDKDIALNKALWTLTEKMAELKAAN